MYEVGIVVFSVCLCSIRCEISYKIIQSDNEPSVLKMKVGGSIEVPSSELFKKNFRLLGKSEFGIPLRVAADIAEVQKTVSMPDGESQTGEKNTQKTTSYSSGVLPGVTISDDSVEFSEKESTGVDETTDVSDQNPDNSYSAEDSSSEHDNNSVMNALRTAENEIAGDSKDQNPDNTYSAEDSSAENDSDSVMNALKTAENEIAGDSKDQSSDDSESAGNSESKEESIILTGGLKFERNGKTNLTDVQDDVNEAISTPHKKVEGTKRNKRIAEREDGSSLIPLNNSDHTTTAASLPTTTKFVRHMIQDDERLQKFIKHVYEQALKAFEAMKNKADFYTRHKIDALTEIYKEKFTDFVDKTRKAYIKTKQGTQNVILHTIDTSNLIMERIVNFLKTDVLGDTAALRQGGASRLQKELDTVKTLEFEHACKTYGVCRSSNGFRNEILNIISTLLIVPDHKLLQANDAATEILKRADLSAFSTSYSILNRIKAAIKSYERADATTLRKDLGVLFGVLHKSHLPLILDKTKPLQKHSVKRTVSFHNLLDRIEDALPPTDSNKIEWESIANRLRRWADGGVSDVQTTFETLFNHINKGLTKNGERSENIRKLIEEIAE